MHALLRYPAYIAMTALVAGSVLLGTGSPASADETATNSSPAITDIGITDGKVVPSVYYFRPTVTEDVVKSQAFIDGDATNTKCSATTPTRLSCRLVLYSLPDDQDATVTLHVEDAAGHPAEATARIHVDNQKPTLTLTPAAKSMMRGGPVTITLHDMPADTKDVDVYEFPGGGSIPQPTATLNAEPWTYTWQATSAEQSPCFTIWDKAGNTRQFCTDYVVDDAGPAVTVTPGNRALIRGIGFTTTVTTSDPAGIGRSYLTGTDGTGRPTSYTSATVKTGKDGNRTLTWVVLDKLGNQTTVSRTVIVDNTAPTLTVTKQPANKAKLTKKTTLAAKASDRNGITRVQMLVNGKVAATDTHSAYALTLDPKKYGRTFTVQLRAYDKAGNVRYSTKRTYRR